MYFAKGQRSLLASSADKTKQKTKNKEQKNKTKKGTSLALTEDSRKGERQTLGRVAQHNATKSSDIMPQKFYLRCMERK
jgi:hypothetical protein